MVDIQSVAAEIRWGKKIDDRKIEITGQKYNGSLLHRAAINIMSTSAMQGGHNSISETVHYRDIVTMEDK